MEVVRENFEHLLDSILFDIEKVFKYAYHSRISLV